MNGRLIEMNINDITVIIPTRTNVSHLQKSITSLRRFHPTIKILVGADNPTKEVREWLANNNKGNFDYTIFEASPGQDRVGIIKVYQALIDKVQTDLIYLVHDDMVFGQHTITKLINKWEPNHILSSRRIEPPIYGESVEKIVIDLGTDPENFSDDKFLQLEREVLLKDRDIKVKGFFAPHFFKKTDWVGYDPLFYPQSREDSDLALRFLEKNYKLYTVWDSVVYHFSGKGSRRKDGQTNSEEWQKTNYKNTRNYIRKHHTLKHTQFILPIEGSKVSLGAVILVGNEIDLLAKFLMEKEPWFDEIVLVVDTDVSPNHDLAVRDLVQQYCKHELSFSPTNFNPEKIKIISNPLNNDFANQTNTGAKILNTDWYYRHDLDEIIDETFIDSLRNIIDEQTKSNPNVSVFGFPRLNYLDNKLSNDIPREHWFIPLFDRYPNKDTVNNPDVQFRLCRKDIEWVGNVHEIPKPIKQGDNDCFGIVRQLFIIHPKSRQKQLGQEQKYSQINKKETRKINKIVYDSIIYTEEGITKHAVEEIKELKKRGYEIFLLDANYKDIHGEEFKDLYRPWDFTNDDYITIVNQPPERWQHSAHFKNRIGYLAFEGKLPKRWVEMINSSNIMELWTPSEYCKKTFIESGISKPIYVIPHGVDSSVWISNSTQNETTKFLAVLTAHNMRKGHDLIAKAFSEEFKPDENVSLTFKVNKIYNPKESFNKEISKYINWDGNTNIFFQDTNVSEKELVELFNAHDVYISASRSEGFGINILNAMAIGMTVVSTQGTGMDDFLNDSVYKVKMDKPKWSKYNWVYERAKWPEPNIDDLKKQIRKAYTEKRKANLEKEKWSWSSTVDKMENRLKQMGF